MKNAVGMTPLTVVLAVLIGGALAGPIGSILAIPVAAAVQVLVQDLIKNRSDDPDNIVDSIPEEPAVALGRNGAADAAADTDVVTAGTRDGN
jgi:hypothetical protein